MKRVYDILQEIASTSSTNDKQAILEANKDNDDLKIALKLMCDETCFYIKKIPPYETYTASYEQISLRDAISRLRILSERELTGNDAITYLTSILSCCSSEDAEIIARIIKKDPDCGVSHKIVNKVWKKLIPKSPYMRCEKPSEIGRITYPALMQTKADGMFANIILEEGRVLVTSRNGKVIDLLGKFENKVAPMLEEGYVYHGELLVMRNGQILDRKTGNGILNKAIKGTITEEDADCVVAKLWDMIPIPDFIEGKCEITCEVRFSNLDELHYERWEPYASKPWVLAMVDHRFVHSYEEAQEFFKDQLYNGEEGAIAKNLDGIWKDGTSKDCIKMKEELDCDLLCYDTLPHEKDPDLIGALCCKSADGEVVVNVGSGLSQKDREKDPKEFVDKICAIKYNELITSKNKEGYSLFLPRLIEVREDKSEADTIERFK